MNEILEYLKKHGEQMDTAIAAATRMSLSSVRQHLIELTAQNAITSCHSIRFEKGKQIEGMVGRIAGYIPPAKPGAKSKVQLTLS
jgi:predicted ArsR family transcriptional regulator